MILRNFAEGWVGSKAKLKIVLFLLSGIGPTGERELARRISLSHVAVGKALRDLERVNFVSKTNIGNVNVWSVNEKSYAYLVGAHLEELAKTPPLLHLTKNLQADFGEAYSYIERVVLFGSVAEGKETERSDIDVFILVKDSAHKKAALKQALSVSGRYEELYGNALSPVIMTGAETKRNSKLLKNIERGIVIR